MVAHCRPVLGEHSVGCFLVPRVQRNVLGRAMVSVKGHGPWTMVDTAIENSGHLPSFQSQKDARS